MGALPATSHVVPPPVPVTLEATGIAIDQIEQLLAY